jgi:hypothetical protein
MHLTREQKMFVPNSIAEITEVFRGHEKIWSLGIGRS